MRENLSKGLGFSKEDRDTNIRRIGFVANLLARNGCVAVTAAISPYREIRDEVRKKTQAAFVEVYVEALEAQARRTPVPRTVTEDEANRVLDEVRGLATPDELSAIQAGGSDSTKSDAVQCAVLRAVFDISLRLPAADLATLARYRMQP